MHATSCAKNFGHPYCNCGAEDKGCRCPGERCAGPPCASIVRPASVDTYHYKSSGTPLWTRVRNRAKVIFSTERTSHEMVLVFEALQDAHNRIEALEKERDAMRVEIPRT